MSKTYEQKILDRWYNSSKILEGATSVVSRIPSYKRTWRRIVFGIVFFVGHNYQGPKFSWTQLSTVVTVNDLKFWKTRNFGSFLIISVSFSFIFTKWENDYERSVVSGMQPLHFSQLSFTSTLQGARCQKSEINEKYHLTIHFLQTWICRIMWLL